MGEVGEEAKREREGTGLALKRRKRRSCLTIGPYQTMPQQEVIGPASVGRSTKTEVVEGRRSRRSRRRGETMVEDVFFIFRPRHFGGIAGSFVVWRCKCITRLSRKFVLCISLTKSRFLALNYIKYINFNPFFPLYTTKSTSTANLNDSKERAGELAAGARRSTGVLQGREGYICTMLAEID